MTIAPSYKPRNFPLSGLTGISDKTLEMHFGLYEGYVNETNLLTERLAELDRDGKAAKNSAYAEMKRHLSYEYGGMILHEYYFDNLAPKGKGKPSSELTQAFEQSFGGLGAWRDDFVATGGMRGVGWAVVFRDPVTGRLSNQWITLHEQGVPAGFAPILVMDAWELFANVNWQEVGERLLRASRTAK
jgi:Fe-Mn family superoxide dismutase